MNEYIPVSFYFLMFSGLIFFAVIIACVICFVIFRSLIEVLLMHYHVPNCSSESEYKLKNQVS